MTFSLHDELQELIHRIEQTVILPQDPATPDRQPSPPSPDMNSTKRKFNALLSSIGTSPSDDLTLRPKQPRTSYSSSSPHASHTSRTAAVSKMSKTDLKFSRSSSGSKKPGATDEPAKPTFLPGDRDDFLQRLATFRNISDWMPKPAAVNEVAWAKRGWVCRRLERVRCVSCNVELMVKLNKQEDESGKVIKFAGQEGDIEQALVDKYAALMITSHDPLCPWRTRGCDASIFKQPVYPASNTLHALQARYASLAPMAALLPDESVFKLPDAYDLDAIIPHLPSSFFRAEPATPAAPADPSSTASPPQPNRPALLLALFGFAARPDHVPKLGAAACAVCFRTVGLWLYRPKTAAVDGVSRAPAMPRLNPLECHKEYCPWVNGASQNPGVKEGEDGKPLWGIVREVVVGREGRVKEGVGKEAEGTEGEGEFEKKREEKDKERWARLRRVKSLFEPKGKKAARGKQ